MSGGADIVLAAGGTGGHVFPAQSLAVALLERGRALALVTDRRGAALGGGLAGIACHQIRAGTTSGRSLGGKIVALADVAVGLWEARRLLARLAPRAVVGFGGYPALPTLLAATNADIPTLIHEQNAVLGRVNRLLAPRVTAIATSWADTAGLKPEERGKTTVTGNPVRPEIAALRRLPYTAPAADDAVELLVLGGSQGAAILGRVMPAALSALAEPLRRRLRVSQQCRADDIDEVALAYKQVDVAVELATFFDDVPRRLERAHLVIARAGASTVSELTAAGRPSILVPFRHATHGHQARNARVLAEAGAAWMVEEHEVTAEALAEHVRSLIEEPARLAAAAACARAAGSPDAAARLADLVERLAPGNGGRAAGDDETGQAREVAA